jgi:tetratricopeptide (TPR) repeat protein
MSDHAERAWLLIRQDRYEQAIDAAAEAIRAEPQGYLGFAYLALAYRGLQKSKCALEAATRAVALAPDTAYPHLVLSLVHWSRADFSKANVHAIEAVRLKPEYAEAHALRAELAEARQRWKSAEVHARTALTLDARHIGSMRVLGSLLLRSDRKDAAREVLDSGLEIDPECAGLLAARGHVALADREPRRALDLFAAALRLEPAHESGREGMLEALKRSYRAYRVAARLRDWVRRRGVFVFFGTLGLIIATSILSSRASSWFAVVRPFVLAVIVVFGLQCLLFPLIMIGVAACEGIVLARVRRDARGRELTRGYVQRAGGWTLIAATGTAAAAVVSTAVLMPRNALREILVGGAFVFWFLAKVYVDKRRRE